MGESPEQLPVNKLGAGTRVERALEEAGFETVQDILDALEAGGEEALLEVKGIGPRSLSELKETFQVLGVPFPTNEIEAEGEVEQPDVEEEPAAAAVAAVAEEAPFGERLTETVRHGFDQLSLGIRPFLVVGVLVIIALLLPPFSLVEQAQVIGSEVLDAANSSVSHPDGLTMHVDSDEFTGKTRVRLSSVPRRNFLRGEVKESLVAALQPDVLPETIQIKSPLYEIWTRGEITQSVTIDIVVPNNAEPWEALDLYTWNGESWAWIPSELHTETTGGEFLRARVKEIPQNVVVALTEVASPSVATVYAPGDRLEGNADLVDVVRASGLLLGENGSVVGEPRAIPEGEYAVQPVIRNWTVGQGVDVEAVADLLADLEAQQAHVARLLQVLEEGGFDGLALDYRGVREEQQAEFTAFVGTLADELHRAGKELTVVLEPPAQSSDGEWAAAGYDWAAIGAAADVVEVPFPVEPTAYGDDGLARQTLAWATARVPRTKLRMRVTSQGVDQVGDSTHAVTLDQALASLGEVIALVQTEGLEPGAEATFSLAGQVKSITAEHGAYRLECEGDDGQERVTWITMPEHLADKLKWAERYRLDGVVIGGLLAPDNMSGIREVVAQYRGGTMGDEAPPADALQIAWQTRRDEETIDSKVSPLTEPAYTVTLPVSGTYAVEATVGGFNRGEILLDVVEPVLEPDLDLVERGTETETVTSTLACLEASFVTDVTVPDGTQFDKGEVFTKTWRMVNSGTCDWPEETEFRYMYGAQMGGPDSVPVGSVEVDEEVDISVQLTAPDEDGDFDAGWLLMVDDFEMPGGWGTVVIQSGEGAIAEEPTAPAPTNPAPISGGPFELGGHVHDIGHPYADMMHYAGMTWSKVQVRYRSGAAHLIRAAHDNGFKIQLSALGPAGMVTEPGFEEDIANWVADMAAAGADAIEVWNEPNIAREWAAGHISPEAYTSLLCTAYNAIKQANPNTLVISAAPAPTGWFGGCGPNGCDDLPFLQGMYNAGAANCMDYIGAHHNAGATSPSATIGHPADPGSTHHSWFFLPQTQNYFNAFGGTRQLFYTEMGYVTPEGTCSDGLPSNFSWGNGTSLAEQGQWLAEAVRLSAQTGLVRCVIVWNVDFTRNDCGGCDPGQRDCDPQASFAIIRPGGSCPTCDVLHSVLGTR